MRRVESSGYEQTLCKLKQEIGSNNRDESNTRSKQYQ